MDRRQGVDGVVRALRRVNFQGSIFGQSVAIRLGLSESDIDALELLIDTGAATAGRLSEVMGLTTGAVTRVIDRLEQAGYVRRTTDPADRRRVVIEVVPERVATVESLLDSLGTRRRATSSGTRTSSWRRSTTSSRGWPTSPRPRRRASAPTHGAPDRPGRAVRAHGAAGRPDVRAAARSAPARRTCGCGRAARPGPVPRPVRGADPAGPGARRPRARPVPGHAVRLAQAHRHHGAQPAIPWAIEVVGGINRVEADLIELDLHRFELTGGSERIQLEVGRPHGEVPVRIDRRRQDRSASSGPSGVPVRLAISGGVGLGRGRRPDDRPPRREPVDRVARLVDDRRPLQPRGHRRHEDRHDRRAPVGVAPTGATPVAAR